MFRDTYHMYAGRISHIIFLAKKSRAEIAKTVDHHFSIFHLLQLCSGTLPSNLLRRGYLTFGDAFFLA